MEGAATPHTDTRLQGTLTLAHLRLTPNAVSNAIADDSLVRHDSSLGIHAYSYTSAALARVVEPAVAKQC